jgi:hypothetical protein
MGSMNLERFDEEYAKAEAPENQGGDELPDGIYHVKVDEVELGYTKTSGDPILKWQLEVEVGPHAGRKLFRNNLFATVSNLSYLKKDLAICGLVLTKLSDLEDRLEQLLDVELEVKQKTNRNGDKEYRNVYFQKRIAAGSLPSNGAKPKVGAAVGTAKGLDEDLPF